MVYDSSKWQVIRGKNCSFFPPQISRGARNRGLQLPLDNACPSSFAARSLTWTKSSSRAKEATREAVMENRVTKFVTIFKSGVWRHFGFPLSRHKKKKEKRWQTDKKTICRRCWTLLFCIYCTFNRCLINADCTFFVCGSSYIKK